jgi:hypothetical protein
MLRALPPTVWLLGAISLLNDAASELVYPLIPLYLATVLGSGPRALGFIEGAAEATAALLKLVSGAPRASSSGVTASPPSRVRRSHSSRHGPACSCCA